MRYPKARKSSSSGALWLRVEWAFWLGTRDLCDKLSMTRVVNNVHAQNMPSIIVRYVTVLAAGCRSKRCQHHCGEGGI